jgi:hypothetical protein
VAAVTLYQITYERVGRHGSQRPDSPPAPAPYPVRAADAYELAHEVLADVRRYLGSRYVEVAVSLEEMRGMVLSGERLSGSFSITVLDEPETAVPAVPVAVEPEPVELPSVTKTSLGYLERFAADTVYVYREFAKPGSGVSRPALDRLIRDGLVELGDHDPKQGRLVQVTTLGHAVLAAQEG